MGRDLDDLPVEDESVDGYWSLGVIEHFYDGYGEILSEMHRVIKRDGFFDISAYEQIETSQGTEVHV